MSTRTGRGFFDRLRRRAPAKIVALTAVRNEDWILGLTLRASLSYCDAVVITDHRSEDGTAAIIEAVEREFPQREISVRRCEDSEWMEMDVRRELLERGRALGGTHFVLADADELPTGNLLDELRTRVLATPPGRFRSLPMISAWQGCARYRWEGAWGEDSRVPWCFADTPDLHYAGTGEHQLHRRVPFMARPARRDRLQEGAGGLFHLQFLDRRRLAAKSAWYKMIESLRYPGRRTPAQLNHIYDWTLREDGARLRDIPESWWAPYRERGWLDFLKPEAPPWHLPEVRRLHREHGAETFAGLDLHGLA